MRNREIRARSRAFEPQGASVSCPAVTQRGDDGTTVVGFEIERDEVHGVDGGFLGVRRLHLSNRRADGSLSPPFICDFIVRPKGVDAVVVAVFHRPSDGPPRVLLRRGLRPALAEGRAGSSVPIADEQPYLTFTELVAGIIETSDEGRDGVRARAAIEVAEESGYTVEASAVAFLGAGTFPTPGSMPEKFWLTAVEVDDPADRRRPEGDGSPMEEGAASWWMPLDEAIAACVDGRIEDAKTEIALRRLADRLATGTWPGGA